MSRRSARAAHPRRSFTARVVAVPVSLVLGAVIAGCSPTPDPGPSASTSSPAPAPDETGASTAAPGPVLVPGGSADDNLPLFAAVTAAIWATPDRVAGRAYIDALVSAGFDKSAMQVTRDESTVGNPAESIQFSVRWGEECLIGQVGPATGEPVTVVMPVLAEGTCLIGQTRPIDW